MSYYISRYHTEAQHEEARKEQAKRASAIMAKIVEALKAKGADIVLKTEQDPKTFNYRHSQTEFDIRSVNGENISYNLEVKLDACYSDSPKEWNMSCASRFTFGWKEKTFIEGKAGFKYDEIADHFINMAISQKERKERENKIELARKSSQQLQNRLKERFGDMWSKPIRSDDISTVDHVQLHVGKTLTVDEAIALLTIIKDAGYDSKIGIQVVNPVTENVAVAAIKWGDSAK